MLSNIFESITSNISSSVSTEEFLICAAAAIASGILVAGFHSFKAKSSISFLMTLVVLPMIVQTVIMIVNGNLGAGVAVAGAFSLVRFRSMPGSSKEIMSVFLSMAAELAIGMGYITIAIALIIVVGIILVIMCMINESFGIRRELKISIPESLDYDDVFTDIFKKYLSKTEFVRVKTTGMGSLFELVYEIVEKDVKNEKKMIDELRTRNGNLPIVCQRIEEVANGL